MLVVQNAMKSSKQGSMAATAQRHVATICQHLQTESSMSTLKAVAENEHLDDVHQRVPQQNPDPSPHSDCTPNNPSAPCCERWLNRRRKSAPNLSARSLPLELPKKTCFFEKGILAGSLLVVAVVLNLPSSTVASQLAQMLGN